MNLARTLARVVALAAVVATPLVALSQTSSDSIQSDLLRFQRVVVPAHEPESWPRRDGERYLPMKGEEFDARVAQLRGDSAAVAESETALLRASYTVESLNGDTISGHLEWDFKGTAKK